MSEFKTANLLLLCSLIANNLVQFCVFKCAYLVIFAMNLFNLVVDDCEKTLFLLVFVLIGCYFLKFEYLLFSVLVVECELWGCIDPHWSELFFHSPSFRSSSYDVNLPVCLLGVIFTVLYSFPVPFTSATFLNCYSSFEQWNYQFSIWSKWTLLD